MSNLLINKMNTGNQRVAASAEVVAQSKDAVFPLHPVHLSVLQF